MWRAGRSPLRPRLLQPASCAALALAACGSGPGITPIRTAFNKAVYLHTSGDLQAAIDEYREALAEDPDDRRARFNLAAALDEQGRELLAAGRDAAAQQALAAAGHEYRTVLARHPDDMRASVNLAALEYERGETGAALARLRAAIAAHPDLALPRTALALRLLQADALAEAGTLLEEALGLEPTDLGANLLLGQLSERLGRTDAARAAYQTALRRAPEDAGVLVALARLELGAGRPAEAEALLQRVLLSPGRNLEAHLLLALLNERRGSLEEAVFHLWQARALDRPQAPQVDYHARLRGLYRRLLDEPPPAPFDPPPQGTAEGAEGAEGKDGGDQPQRNADAGRGRRQ